jgi:hypothetical protein
MEAADSSETFVPTYQTALLHVPKDLNIDTHCGKELNCLSYFFMFFPTFQYASVTFTVSSIHVCPLGGRREIIGYKTSD